MNFDRLSRLIGDNLRRCRKRVGLTQEKLAEKGGFNYKYIQEIEAGRANITVRSLARLGKVVAASPHTLLLPSKGKRLRS